MKDLRLHYRQFSLLGGLRVPRQRPLGSTRTVVEGATVVESTDYDPWGVALPGRRLGGGTKEGFTGAD